MKKSANVDISNLFRKFGGDTGSYKEIQQDYIGEKAQKNWPIVQAVEKERAVAPRLKMASASAPQPAPQPVSPVQRHVAHHHLAVPHAAAPASSIAEQAAPARSLFAGAEPAAPAKPLFSGAEQTAPARSLFAGADMSPQPPSAGAAPAPGVRLFDTLSAAKPPAQEEASPLRSLFNPAAKQEEPVHRSENEPLNAVFSRLLNAQTPEVAEAKENNLRSMLGFLKK